MVNHGRLKRSEPTEEGFVGPPNFVLDVFDGTELSEYESRRAAFARAGVEEYVAVILGNRNGCHWNRHDGTEFQHVHPDNDGAVKSKALPGLWFSTNYEQDQEAWTVLDTIETGVTRLGHHEFMETIWHKDGRKPDWGDWMPFDAG